MIRKTIDNTGGQINISYSLGDGCQSSTIGASSNVPWMTTSVDNSVIHITVEASTEQTDRTGIVTPKVNGEDCNNNIIQVTQAAGASPTPGKPSCIRGTDNGIDIIDGNEYNHPMYLCAPAGTDEDSLYVNNIQIKVGNIYRNLSTDPNNPDIIDWVGVYRTASGGVCGRGILRYVYGENNTSEVKSIRLKFKTTDEMVCDECGDAKKYGFFDACPEWEVEVKQCPCGTYWCGSDSMNRQPIPCDDECPGGSKTCDDKCDCGGGGTCETCDDIEPYNIISYEEIPSSGGTVSLGHFYTKCDYTGRFTCLKTSGTMNVSNLNYYRTGPREFYILGDVATSTVSTSADISVFVGNEIYTSPCVVLKPKQIWISPSCTSCDGLNPINSYSNTEIPANGGTNIILASGTTECDGTANLVAKTLPGGTLEVNNLRVSANNRTFTITGDVSENTTSSVKGCGLALYINNTEGTPCITNISIAQKPSQ